MNRAIKLVVAITIPTAKLDPLCVFHLLNNYLVLFLPALSMLGNWYGFDADTNGLGRMEWLLCEGISLAPEIDTGIGEAVLVLAEGVVQQAIVFKGLVFFCNSGALFPREVLQCRESSSHCGGHLFEEQGPDYLLEPVEVLVEGEAHPLHKLLEAPLGRIAEQQAQSLLQLAEHV